MVNYSDYILIIISIAYFIIYSIDNRKLRKMESQLKELKKNNLEKYDEIRKLQLEILDLKEKIIN